MRATSGFLNLCFLAAVAAIVGCTQAADNWRLADGRRALISLTHFLRPDDRHVVIEDVYAGAKATKNQKDELLREVWTQLFKLGSLLYDYDVALHELLLHLKTFPASASYSLEAFELIEISQKAAEGERAIERHLAGLKQHFAERLSFMAVEQQVDISVLHAKYATLSSFLSALHRAFELRLGQADYLTEQRLLEEMEVHGRLPSTQRLDEVRSLLSSLHYKQQMQDEHLLNMSLEAYRTGMLFKAGFSLIYALLKVDREV